jgi:two-component system sensor histidine kinase KdpD
LARFQEDDRRAQRGKLKVFLGACAGVGKTYAMLEAARVRATSGDDVVVGVVETHGRKETALVLLGLEILPRKSIEYQNVKLEEFDLDAALARKPGLILVDELAHTNAPGSRHAKRWQDVNELLDNGIHVFTTINIQHIESLNDVVAQITGVIVRETVPDSVLEKADEIEVVDLPPQELLKRLAEGKVYFPQQAERARQNFFKEGKLAALRELALRYTAEKVNRQVQSLHTRQTGAPVWPTKERILVCVGPSPSSARLIRAAKRLAESLRGDWLALHIETPATLSGSQSQKDHVNENLRLAERLGAETATVSGANVVEETVAFARLRNVTKIVVGKPVHSRWRQLLAGNLVDDLIRLSADMDVYVIRGESGEARPLPKLSAVRKAISWADYGLSMAVVGVATVLDYFIYEHLELANLVMVYLLGVVFVATRAKRGPAILASVLSVVAFDFFFVPPRFSFSVSDTQYLFTFCVMLVVALVVSTLTVQVRMTADAARLREKRITELHSLSRKLASTGGAETLLEAAVTHISQVFDAQVVALLPDPKGKLVIRAGKQSEFALNPKEQSVAQWAYDLGQIAGLGTETLPSAEALYVPLLATQGPVGALGVRPHQRETLLVPDQLRLLEAFANQTALALERDRLAEESQRQTVEIETERLRGSLLSSVSHDLRTPLTSISGAASSLLEQEARMPPETRKELLQTIHDEADRLTRQVSNLLDMTRLQSGNLQVAKEPQPLEETLGSALNRLDKVLQGRPVRISLPPDLPMVPVDAVLMEQVFFNLLENAAKYTSPETPIEITARYTQEMVTVEIADRGPGFSEGDEERIFDKFYRGQSLQSRPGTGLGLAICKGIIHAHGGRIWAENRDAGGAVFRFSLPLEDVCFPHPEGMKDGSRGLRPYPADTPGKLG